MFVSRGGFSKSRQFSDKSSQNNFMNKEQQNMTIKFSSASELDFTINVFFKDMMLYSEKCMFDFFKLITSILQENHEQLLNLQKEQHEELCMNNLVLSFFPRKSINSKTLQQRENLFSLMNFDSAISKFLIIDRFKTENCINIKPNKDIQLIRTESETMSMASNSVNSRDALSIFKRKNSGSLSGSFNNLSFERNLCKSINSNNQKQKRLENSQVSKI
jgi:hypothetical protein